MTATPAAPHYVLPADRTPMLAVRGRRVDIIQAINQLYEGELCWAEDEGVLYIVTRVGGAKQLHQASAGVFIANQPPAVQGAVAPASPEIGMVWYDTTSSELYIWDGTNWLALGEHAPTLISATRPASPADRQFWLDTSNAQQPRLFLYDNGRGDFVEIIPPMASATNDGLLSQGDWQKLQGLRNAAIPDWNAGPGVAGEILNKPVISPPPPLASETVAGIVLLARDSDLGDPSCRDRAVVAAQVAWLKAALDWWRSTWLPGNHLSCVDTAPGLWNGRDDTIEVLGPIEINVDGRGWSVGPEPVIRNQTVEGRWSPSAIADLDDGEVLTGSLVCAVEQLRVDYTMTVQRQMEISSVEPVVDAPLNTVVESDVMTATGSNLPYQIWALSEAPMAEISVDEGDWEPADGRTLVHGCGEARIRVRHLTRPLVSDESRTWVFVGTLAESASTAFHSITVPVLAPELGRVQLLERNPGGDRFTDQSFDLEAVLRVPGEPPAARLARFEVRGRVDRPVITDAITQVDGGAAKSVRVSSRMTSHHRHGARSPYPKIYGYKSIEELEDPVKAADYVPTSVSASCFHEYPLNSGRIPMQFKHDKLLVQLVDAGASGRHTVVLPWADFSDRHWWGDHHYKQSATLRVYVWDQTNGWRRDGEITGARPGADHRYTLTQPSQWLAVSLEASSHHRGKDEDEEIPPFFRIESGPLKLTFRSNRDLDKIRVGDRVWQDDAQTTTGPTRLRVSSYRNELVNGLRSVRDLPFQDTYSGLGMLSSRLEDLPAIDGKECAWLRYHADSDGAGVLGFVVRCRRETSTVYIKVRRSRYGHDHDHHHDHEHEFGHDYKCDHEHGGEHAGEVLERHVVVVDENDSESRDSSKIVRVQLNNLPKDGYVTLQCSHRDHIHILYFGGIGSSYGPAATVSAVDQAALTLTLEKAVGQFRVGQTVLAPRQVLEDLHRWLDIDAHGVVRGMMEAAPAWREYPFVADMTTIHFPAVWDSGRAPDVDLPPGTSLSAEVQAVNIAGMAADLAPPITPGSGTLAQGVITAAFDDYEKARVAALRAAELRLAALGMSTTDIAALHL